MDEIEFTHSMTYAEREALKRFADQGECLAEALIMIAHWMRQPQDVSFTGYAENWIEANRRLRSIDAMRKVWPFQGLRFIKDGSSEWGSAIPET